MVLYQSAIKFRRGFVQPSPAFFLHLRERRRALVPGEDDFLIGFLGLLLHLFSRLALFFLLVDPPTHLLFLRLQPLVQIEILALEPTQPLIFHRSTSLQCYAHYHCTRVSRLRVKIIILAEIFATYREEKRRHTARSNCGLETASRPFPRAVSFPISREFQ